MRQNCAEPSKGIGFFGQVLAQDLRLGAQGTCWPIRLTAIGGCPSSPLKATDAHFSGEIKRNDPPVQIRRRIDGVGQLTIKVRPKGALAYGLRVDVADPKVSK